MTEPIGALKPAWQWAILVGLSVVLGGLLIWLELPAALLLGPMVAAIAVSIGGARVKLHGHPFALAQGLIGCMIAEALPMSISGTVFSHATLFVLGVFSVIAASFLIAWLMTRLHVLPGTTSIWGLSPGAASAMVLMAEAHGADAGMVAFMQYLRVVMVVSSASAGASLLGAGAPHPIHTIAWFPPIAWLPLAETVGLVAACAIASHWLRLRSGALLLPVVIGGALTHLGLMTIELPRWLLVIAYALVGWRIGLRFTRGILLHVARTLPRIVLSIVALIAICGAIAGALVLIAGFDPLTAYLATSPGGADTVAIIATSAHVDAPFVMAMQMARFLTVLVLGPALARFMAAQVSRTTGRP